MESTASRRDSAANALPAASRAVSSTGPTANSQRIILITRGYQLVSLDAKTGLPDPTFGRNGVIDLYRISISRRRRTASSAPHRRPSSSGTSIVIGAAMVGGTAPRSKENTKGYIRGFDVSTGKRLWTFHTIPQPGEFGNDTWFNDSWAYTGNTTVWSPFSADEELGYVYLPVESATGDYYGGHRPGNNLFAGSLVCLDARTGKRVWHHQLVHHDIWDYDLASPPTLINITVNGKPIRAVAQVTNGAICSCSIASNGTPVWPIEERKVEAGDRRRRMVFADRSRTRPNQRRTIGKASRKRI